MYNVAALLNESRRVNQPFATTKMAIDVIDIRRLWRVGSRPMRVPGLRPAVIPDLLLATPRAMFALIELTV
jgi:hypothetical protein